MKGTMQRIYFNDIYLDHVGDICKEMFVEKLYDRYFQGRKDLTVLDIGANIGLFSYFAYPFSKIIYALEPATVPFELLSLMVRDNELPKILPVKLGISNVCGDQTFYLNPANTTANMLSKYVVEQLPTIERETIQTVTLEKLVEMYEIKQVDVLKLDVEGEEAKIFSHESFDKVCDKVKTILVEYHEWSGVSQDQLKWMLLDRGYKVEQLNTNATVFVGERA